MTGGIMARKHALIVSLTLGLALAAGTIAAVRTTQAAHPAATVGRVSSSSLELRSKALDRVQASLQRALVRRPPKLPRVPSLSPATAAPAAAPPQIQYVRPAPIVVIKHRHHDDDSEDEHESESEGRDD
jgi:hypothetical protein